jgi:hypothetical protein
MNVLTHAMRRIFNKFQLFLPFCSEKVIPERFYLRETFQMMTIVYNFNQPSIQSKTMTCNYSEEYDPHPMPIQQFNHRLEPYRKLKSQEEELNLNPSIYNFIYHKTQVKQTSKIVRGAEQMNILNIGNKSMIIVQLKEKSKFKKVYLNLKELDGAYLFYEEARK